MTPFSNIYSRFLRKITDYRLANLDVDTMENRIYGWMESAIPKFSKCQKNLSSREVSAKQFNDDLSETEEEILSNLMVVEWLEPEVKSIMEMKNLLYNDDFKLYSTANLLKEKKELLEESVEKADRLIVQYTFDTVDFEKFGSS